MKKMTVTYGILLAVIFAVAAPVVVTFLQFVFYPIPPLRSFIAVAVVVYGLAIVSRSERKSGRVFAIISACTLEFLLFLSGIPLELFVLGSTGIVWLVRSILLGRNALHVGAEALLVGGALVCGGLGLAATGSVVVMMWAMMLMLAAGPCIASWFKPSPRAATSDTRSLPRFERAYQAAERAIGALSRAGGY